MPENDGLFQGHFQAAITLKISPFGQWQEPDRGPVEPAVVSLRLWSYSAGPVAIDFSPYRAILLDLDGTLYHEEHPLPGAIELIRRMQAEGRTFACLSNATTSPQRISQRLDRMGVQVRPEQIFTAASAAVDFVMERWGPLPRVFNCSTEGVESMLMDRVHWVERADEPCDVVVAGAMTNVFATEPRLRTALLLLRRGAKLIGICADRVYPSVRGLEFGSGALSALLSYASGVTPIFMGKPQKVFFEGLCQKLGVKTTECILIGDNLESDIGGARNVGMHTILTLTGVATRQDLAKLPAEHQPTFVVDDLTQV